MRIKVVIGTVALTLAASVLAGCGSDSGDSSSSGDYCQELKSDKAFLATFTGSNPDLSKLDEVFQRMHTLADDAPDDIASDWKTLDEALTTIETALKEAGLKPSDLDDLHNGQPPAGVDPSQLQALSSQLQALDSTDVNEAATRIATHAKDTCGVDLNAS